MKLFINILLIISAVILQTSLLPKISFFGSFPNLIFLIMLSLLFINRVEEAVWWMGIGGIMLDLFSPLKFGFYTLYLLAIFILNYMLVRRVFSDPSLLLGAVFFFFNSIILNLFFSIFNPPIGGQFSILVIEAIYSTIIGVIIYVLFKYYLEPKESIKI